MSMDVKAQKYTHEAEKYTQKCCRTRGGCRLWGGRRSLPAGSWLCGLLQVPAVLFCSFLMEHSSCLKGSLVWMQHFQPEGRWDSRSSALWLGRFEIRAWNGERERERECSNASSSPRHSSVRENKVNFKYL